MLVLDAEQRRALRARAHALNPVVAIAQNGLSETVMKEIDRCLSAHELIKIRVYSDSREEREAHLGAICASLNAAAVQHIGKLLVIWRPAPPDQAAAKPARRGRKPARRAKRSFQD